MNPDTLKNLLSSPDFHLFVDYLAGRAASLNSLADIELADAEEYALEGKSRQKAYKLLVEIVSPLLDPRPVPPADDPGGGFAM